MRFKNPGRDFYLKIDDEYDTFWAYLINNKNEIIADCWISNKSNIPQRDIHYYKDNKIPPPAREEFIERNMIMNSDDSIFVKWNDQLEEVSININGENCIKFSYSKNRGFNKYLKKSCPWGNKW